MTFVDERAHGGLRIMGVEIRGGPIRLILGPPDSSCRAAAVLIGAGLGVSVILDRMARLFDRDRRLAR